LLFVSTTNAVYVNKVLLSTPYIKLRC
jgi:hypothetical protein